MQLSVLRGGSRKSDRGAGQCLSGGGAAPFSPVSSSTASVKLLPKNSMTKSTGPPPLLWLWRYHLLPRTVKLSCRFHRYSCPARSSGSPCDCRKETRSAWLARSICSWEEYADLKTQRDSDYTKLKDTRAEVAELQKIRKCVDIALRADQPEQTQNRAKRHEQER